MMMASLQQFSFILLMQILNFVCKRINEMNVCTSVLIEYFSISKDKILIYESSFNIQIRFEQKLHLCLRVMLDNICTWRASKKKIETALLKLENSMIVYVHEKVKRKWKKIIKSRNFYAEYVHQKLSA